MFTPAPLRAGSLAAMTDPTPPDTLPTEYVDEAPDAGAEGHDVPADLVELHGLIELANNGGPA
jgi:hypothetical protein